MFMMGDVMVTLMIHRHWRASDAAWVERRRPWCVTLPRIARTLGAAEPLRRAACVLLEH